MHASTRHTANTLDVFGRSSKKFRRTVLLATFIDSQANRVRSGLLFRLRILRRDERAKAVNNQVVIGPVVQEILPVSDSEGKSTGSRLPMADGLTPSPNVVWVSAQPTVNT